MTIAAVAALTAGCGGGDQGAAEGATPAAASTSPTAASGSMTTAPPPAAPQVVDAESVLVELRNAGLPITDSVTITETNDGNNLIGRPGQYVSKVVFADSRIGTPIDRASPGNDAGGSLEVFASASDAQARSDYIQRTLQSLGPIAGTEYHYLAGTALVRVTGEMLPSAAAEYETAVARLS